VLLGLAGLVAILVVIAEGIAAGVLNLVPVALVFGWAAVVQWEHGPGKAAVPLVAIPALAVFAFVAFIAIGCRRTRSPSRQQKRQARPRLRGCTVASAVIAPLLLRPRALAEGGRVSVSRVAWFHSP
jgi:hypothetical protein